MSEAIVSAGATEMSRFLDSPLHEAFRKFAEHSIRCESGETPIPLHVGEPGFAPPEGVIEAVARAFADGGAGYCDAAGLTSLRGMLADKVRSENQISATTEQILVTPGSTQALFALFTALASPGDQVLLPLPYWPIYGQQCAALGLHPRFYRVSADGAVDLDELRAALSPATRFMLVNSPSNPTGAVLSERVMREIIELTAPLSTPLISDEAYEDFAFAHPHVSLARLEGERCERRRVWTTFTFSKTFALTGLRVGYVVAPHLEGAALLRRVQEASIVCPSTPAQRGAEAALYVRPAAVVRARAHVQNVFNAAVPALVQRGLLMHAPEGGWYAMCRTPEHLGSAEILATRLLEQESVGIAPGRSFTALSLQHQHEGERSFRIALCGSADAAREGVRRLCASLNRLE